MHNRHGVRGGFAASCSSRVPRDSRPRRDRPCHQTNRETRSAGEPSASHRPDASRVQSALAKRGLPHESRGHATGQRLQATLRGAPRPRALAWACTSRSGRQAPANSLRDAAQPHALQAACAHDPPARRVVCDRGLKLCRKSTSDVQAPDAAERSPRRFALPDASTFAREHPPRARRREPASLRMRREQKAPAAGGLPRQRALGSGAGPDQPEPPAPDRAAPCAPIKKALLNAGESCGRDV